MFCYNVIGNYIFIQGKFYFMIKNVISMFRIIIIFKYIMLKVKRLCFWYFYNKKYNYVLLILFIFNED